MDRECAFHPGVKASYWCAKYEKYLCDECMKCQDPGGYCKFRTSCMIWEMVKHGEPKEVKHEETKEEAAHSSEVAHAGGQQ